MRLAAEEHVLHDVEVVAEREILVDDLDPELRRVLRARRCAPGLPSKKISPESAAWMPGDRLDQRRLAGAVVADERHHLAAVHLEIDVRQRLDRAEATSRCPGARGEGIRLPRRYLFLTRSGRPVQGAPTTVHAILAVLLERAVADVALLEEAARVELPPVRLGDRDRLDDVRRLLLSLPFGTVPVVVSFWPLRSCDRGRAPRPSRGSACPSRRSSTASREMMYWTPCGVASWPVSGIGLRPCFFSADDDRARDAVVRRRDRVDLVARLDEHLIEDRRRPSGCPSRARTDPGPS